MDRYFASGPHSLYGPHNSDPLFQEARTKDWVLQKKVFSDPQDDNEFVRELVR